MKSFKEYLEQRLDEMPLASYHTQFNFESPDDEDFLRTIDGRKVLGNQSLVSKDGKSKGSVQGFFSRKDRAVISHPRTLKILERKLSSSKYKFNLLFIDLKEKIAPYQRYLYDDYVKKFIEKNNLQIEGHITFVKNSTSGHVMTPWMIFHTIGHAVGDFLYTNKLEGERFAIEDLIDEIASYVDNLNPNPGEHKRVVLSKVFVFNSATVNPYSNDSSIRNASELFHELIAEYLWNQGKIRVDPFYQEHDIIMRKIQRIELGIEKSLRHCVGEIIYDFGF